MARSLAALSPCSFKDRAHRHATNNDLEHITYTVSLGAWREPADLSKRARRVLRWYAALNRGGGWLGIRAVIAIAAASCARATGEASSRTTWCRGNAELVEQGYVENGTYRGGKAREYTPGEWARDPIAVYTLTEKALAVWSYPTLTVVPLPVSKCDSDEISRACFKQDSSAPVVNVEHLDENSQGVAVADGDDSPGGSQSARRQADKPSSAPDRRNAGKSEPAISGPRKNCKTARGLLAIIRECARRDRAGRAAVARAALELSDPRASTSAVEWAYWLRQWPTMGGGERRHFVRAEILPVLISAPPMVHQLAVSQPSPATSAPPNIPPPDPPASLIDTLEAAAQNGNQFARDYLQRQREQEK